MKTFLFFWKSMLMLFFTIRGVFTRGLKLARHNAYANR